MEWSMKKILLGSTVVAALAFPAAALAHSDKIVINKSIDGVRLGMTEGQVKKVEGMPSEIVGANTPYTEFNYGDADQLEVDFDMVHGKKLVTTVTVEPGYEAKTSKGITFSSTERAVLRAYPAAKFLNNVGQIWIDQEGTYNTSFLLSRSNRVIQIAVGWNYG
jgi:hypothetical protein